MTAALDAYDFAAAVKALYRFVWNDVCDWYLEAAKTRLYGDDAVARRDVSETLLYVLRATLRLAHPVLPHVTERIWGELGEDGVLARSSVARPLAGAARRARPSGPWQRGLRVRREAAPACAPTPSWRRVRRSRCRAGRSRCGRRRWSRRSAASSTAAADGEWRAVDVIAVGDAPVTVLAPGGADDARPRLEQELVKAEAEIERARRKLADERFVERAPAHLVQEERDKLERFEREADELRERLAALGA